MKKQVTHKATSKDVIKPKNVYGNHMIGQHVINDELNLRDKYLTAGSKVNERKADEIQEMITYYIKKYFDKYPVDFIIETWTRFGAAPQVVYDDNGLFAVSGDGYSQAVWGNQKIEGTIAVGVTKSMWKKTIREALKHWLKIK